MKNLGAYLKGFKLQLILGPFFKFLEAVLELLNPILMARIIDVGIKNQDNTFIIKYGIIILVCNIVAFCFALICQKSASVASTGIATNIRKDMYRKINDFSHREIDAFGTSSLVTRLTNDVYKVQSLISMVIRMISRTLFLLLGSLIMSIFINARLSLIFCVVLPIIVSVLIYFTKKTMPFFKILREKLDVVSRITRENLDGVRVIRAFNHQKFEENRFSVANHDLIKDSIKVSKITSLLNPFIFLIVDFAIIFVLYFGAIQVNIGGLSQGSLIAFCEYFITISASLIAISRIYVYIVDSTASMHRIEQVLNTNTSVEFDEEKEISIIRRKNRPILEFKNVGFSYDLNEKDEDRMFIKNVNFKLMPNETLGIIGPTGSGKTTLINLIARFYDCNVGEILLFGKNIKDYPKEQLRKIVSITQQRSNLFSGTLRENMSLRDKDCSDRSIIKALKTAQAWEFVQNWPNKLDYKIMVGGNNVSGGQKQRLTIARSLIGKPDLLILDDSSSALDYMTDYKLRKSLKSDMNCSTVIVSQRATTIKNSDLIIVMEHGDIVGMGKHKDLMKNCDLYRETYISQTQREE